MMTDQMYHLFGYYHPDKQNLSECSERTLTFKVKSLSSYYWKNEHFCWEGELYTIIPATVLQHPDVIISRNEFSCIGKLQ
jgi:hypothetical protein